MEIEGQYNEWFRSDVSDVWATQAFVDSVWKIFVENYRLQLLACHSVGVDKEGEPTGGTPIGEMRLHWTPSKQQ
eukprot:2241-Amphidinium_carterae.1